MVHGLLGLLRVGLLGRATHSFSTTTPTTPHSFPVPNKPSRFCGSKATCLLTSANSTEMLSSLSSGELQCNKNRNYFGIRSTPVLPQQHVKDPGHSAKSASGTLQLGTHAPYVERAAVSRATSNASAVSTPLRWIFKNVLLKASHS